MVSDGVLVGVQLILRGDLVGVEFLLLNFFGFQSFLCWLFFYDGLFCSTHC